MKLCCFSGVSKDRVSRVAKYYAQKTTVRPERRGGARKVEENEEKKRHIQAHIQTFKCRASHYGRRGAPGRKYLPCDMNVKKMHELFKSQSHADVSYSLYYSVFRTKFNLGFGHPLTDACADCMNYRISTKDPNLTEEEKRTKAASFILHRRRARAFYDLLGNIEEDTITVCFDMMQNLVLPKTPIGQAYYSRQLYLYVFGVVVHHGKDSHQTKDDIHLYTWMEQQNKKDSNLIASALDHFFRCVVNGQVQKSNTLRLFSDSCFGQNKNMNVLAMLFALRKTVYSNLRIVFTFPIRGHSFLPADRVFGRIEQAVRKKDTILHPKEYVEILQNYGNVYRYGRDWKAFDYKKATLELVKGQRSFKISEARQLEINGDKLGFKPVYNGTFCRHSVLKRGKRWSDFKLNELADQSTVTMAKKKDVQNLLEAIGVSDEVATFYEEALNSIEGTERNDSDDDEF